jgi:hypothetical protein
MITGARAGLGLIGRPIGNYLLTDQVCHRAPYDTRRAALTAAYWRCILLIQHRICETIREDVEHNMPFSQPTGIAIGDRRLWE